MPPPEPNKKIDDLLNAYSRKRREQAEPGFELHPVSRKALLDEVTRTFAETDSKVPARWKFSDWWRWFAVGGVMVWVLILCLYIQIPTTSPVEQNLAKSLPTPVLRSAPMEGAKTADQPKSIVASDSLSHSIAPPAAVPAPSQPAVVTASPPTGANAAEVLQAEKAGAVVSQSGLGVQKKDQSEDKVEAEKAPQSIDRERFKQSSDNAASISGVVQAETRRGQQFVQLDNRAQYRRNVLSPPLPKVLTAFALERNGNKVQITDADGSVYNGEVLQPRREAFGATAKAGSRMTDGEKKSDTNADENYSFQVSGMNQNLKQKVVFTGHVNEASSVGGGQNAAFVAEGTVQAASASTAVNQRAAQNQPSAQNQRLALPQNFSCEGRVQVGKGSEFHIEATPVP